MVTQMSHAGQATPDKRAKRAGRGHSPTSKPAQYGALRAVTTEQDRARSNHQVVVQAAEASWMRPTTQFGCWLLDQMTAGQLAPLSVQTLHDLVARSGISERTMLDWLHGRHVPQVSTLRVLSHALHVSETEAFVAAGYHVVAGVPYRNREAGGHWQQVRAAITGAALPLEAQEVLLAVLTTLEHQQERVAGQHQAFARQQQRRRERRRLAQIKRREQAQQSQQLQQSQQTQSAAVVPLRAGT